MVDVVQIHLERHYTIVALDCSCLCFWPWENEMGEIHWYLWFSEYWVSPVVELFHVAFVYVDGDFPLNGTTRMMLEDP